MRKCFSFLLNIPVQRLLCFEPAVAAAGRVEWEGRWYDFFDEVPKTAKATKKLRQSMFPPVGEPGEPAVPLHRCMRFLPHINNTGALHFRFFSSSSFLAAAEFP